MFVNSVLNAQGDMVSFRNILIFTFVLNIFLDYTFVKLGFGIKGIAYSTVISEAITMFYLLYKLFKTELFKDKICTLKIDSVVHIKLVKEGIPPTANMLFMSLGIFIITYYASEFGEEVVAALGIGMRVEQLALMPIIGLNVAVLTIISQNSGALQYERIREVVKVALKYCFYLSVVTFGALFFFGTFWMQLFSGDMKVISEGVTFLKVEAFLIFPFSMIFIYVALLQGIEKPKFIFYISLVRQILFPLLLLEIVTLFYHDVLLVWLIIALSVILSAVILWRYAIHELDKKESSVK
jgi:putative MATE family efflux protein